MDGLYIIRKSKQIGRRQILQRLEQQGQDNSFFEAFGRYVKEPNKRDIETVYYIWLWACHADHGLAKTIDYTLDWAKMDLYTEKKRWDN